jgi:hypothetical protein
VRIIAIKTIRNQPSTGGHHVNHALHRTIENALKAAVHDLAKPRQQQHQHCPTSGVAGGVVAAGLSRSKGNLGFARV